MRAPTKAAHDMAEAADSLERSIQRGTAGGVVDEIEAFAAGVASHVLRDRLGVVIDEGCAELLDEGALALGIGGKHFGTETLGDLDGDVADAPPPPWTSTFWPAETPARSTSPSHAVMKIKGSCGSLAHGEVGRLRCQQVGVHSRELGERTRQAADAAGHPIDLVAAAEAGDACSHRLDGAREVQAEDGGQGVAGMRGLAGVDLEVERIDAARIDPDKHLARSPGSGREMRARRNGAPVGFEDRGLHIGGGRHAVLLSAAGHPVPAGCIEVRSAAGQKMKSVERNRDARPCTMLERRSRLARSSLVAARPRIEKTLSASVTDSVPSAESLRPV